MEQEQQTQLITKDMTIGDIVQKHPECVETLLSFGVHCVGCHVSGYETLEQGFKGHGMEDEEIEMAVEELNKVAMNTPKAQDKQGLSGHSRTSSASETKEFTITEKAAQKVKGLLEQHNKTSHGLRIEVMPGGCSGFQYGFSFDEKPSNDDQVFEKDGVKIFISSDSMEFLKGAKLEYVETLQEQGFKIHNPNASHSCGCGKSFS